eukprot:gene24852-10511_t
MVIFFKIDQFNKIWLLSCNGLKLDQEAMRKATAPKKNPHGGGGGPIRASILKDPTAVDEVQPIPVDPRPFMCCMTGEMYGGTYKIEFMIVAWYSNESDRYHAKNAIPHSLR